MHSRNQTRFPVNSLRTPTVRLNLDLALPHWRNVSARIPATKRAVWYHTAHACAISDTNDSSRPEIEPWHEATTTTINQSKQAKQQKPVPGAEFQKEFKKLKSGTGAVQGPPDLIRFDLIWFDLIWFDLIWFDLIWVDFYFDLIWFDLTLIARARLNWIDLI